MKDGVVNVGRSKFLEVRREICGRVVVADSDLVLDDDEAVVEPSARGGGGDGGDVHGGVVDLRDCRNGDAKDVVEI